MQALNVLLAWLKFQNLAKVLLVKRSKILMSCVTPDNTVIRIALSKEGHDV